MNTATHAKQQTMHSARTLTAVTGHVGEGGPEEALLLTIIFHPDTNRIGETAVLPPLSHCDHWSLCRLSPLFGSREMRAPLGERDVSRRALVFQYVGERLMIRREPGSSRCRVNGRELVECCELSITELKKGVRLLLGHSTVLLLRFSKPCLHSENICLVQSGMVGRSAYMHSLGDMVQRLAGSDLDVLVRGETGTGKEMIANAIHLHSSRASKAIVSINMSAIPSGLAAATLFGSAKGAYTGAARNTSGFFLQAQGGTLFMDEIGDAPADVQPQLLRALQEREIQGVGGAIRKIDLRVISATDADLDSATCSFNAALRHRLGSGEIRLAALRDHPEDIGDLAWHFLLEHSGHLESQHLLPSPEASALTIAFWANVFYGFLAYDWPGNVRQLSNTVNQILLASTDKLSMPASVASALAPRRDAEVIACVSPAPKQRPLREIAESEFRDALRLCDYEVAKIARRLGVSRQAVYRRIRGSAEYRLASQVPSSELEEAITLRAGDSRAAAQDLKVSASGLRTRLRASDLDWH